MLLIADVGRAAWKQLLHSLPGLGAWRVASYQGPPLYLPFPYENHNGL
jgi:hypothetical protein